MRIKRFLSLDADPPPPEPGLGIIVMQDDVGWYYISALWQREEGPKTPFTSIEEIELYLGYQLILVKEEPTDFDPFEPDPET